MGARAHVSRRAHGKTNHPGLTARVEKVIFFLSLPVVRRHDHRPAVLLMHVCFFTLSLLLSFSIMHFLFSIIFPSVQRGQFYESDCFVEQVWWKVKGTVHIQSLCDGKVKCRSLQIISGASQRN